MRLSRRSRPARARGLKLINAFCSVLSKRVVAPRAGAWIETMKRAQLIADQLCVAPRAGAWIETDTALGLTASATSRPARARGLKRFGIAYRMSA